MRVGGFGSELPLESITVSDTVYVPGFAKVTFWLGRTDVAGVPPGNTQELAAALLVVLKVTAWPVLIVTLPVGVDMAPCGGAVV